jgi:L-lactate dehydrogenase complex protein LldG
MMSENSTAFINRISKSLGRTGIPSAPSGYVSPNQVQLNFLAGAANEELVEVFIKNATVAGTAVYRCTAAELNETILQAIPQLAQGPLLLSDDPLWRELQTVDALRQVYEHVRLWDCQKSREDNLEYAEKAAVGIGMAQLALAETGTVMVYSHEGCGRAVTLLPTTTIFVIPRQDIRPRLTQAMEHLQERMPAGLPASINFISGASSTADIELVRVQGVHGPVKIAYIIIG